MAYLARVIRTRVGHASSWACSIRAFNNQAADVLIPNTYPKSSKLNILHSINNQHSSSLESWFFLEHPSCLTRQCLNVSMSYCTSTKDNEYSTSLKDTMFSKEECDNGCGCISPANLPASVAAAVSRMIDTDALSDADIQEKLSLVVGHVTPELVCGVVKLLKHADAALLFLNWASKQEGYEPRAEAFTHIVARFGRERNFSGAWSLLKEMRKHGLQVDYAFSIFIHRLKRARKMQGIAKAMCSMELLGVKPTIPLYTSALDFLLKNNCSDAAAHVYNQLLQDKIVPDKKLFEMLVVGFGKLGKIEESLIIFDNMKDQGYVPHISVYTALMCCLSECGKLDSGHKMYMEMLRKGALPKILGRHEIACALFGKDIEKKIEKLLDAIMQHTSVRWRVHSLNNLLQHLLDVGKCNEAMETFKKLLAINTRDAPKRNTDSFVNMDSYTIYIIGMCKQGHVTYALEMFRELLQRGEKPSGDVSSLLLASLSSTNMVIEALEISKHITRNRETVSIDAQKSFFTMLRTTKHLRIACKIFLSMKKKGCIDQDSDFVSLVGFDSMNNNSDGYHS